MPFDETNIGDPFYGDFPDLPAEGPWADLAATVQRQVRELQQLRFEPDVRHAFLELLMQRRESAGRVRDPVVTAFDFLPVDVGFDLLLVPGELLLARRPRLGPGSRHQGSPRRPRPGYQRSGLPRATQPGAAADPHRADESAATRGRGRGPPEQWARRIGVHHHGDRADSQAASLGTPGRTGPRLPRSAGQPRSSPGSSLCAGLAALAARGSLPW